MKNRFERLIMALNRHPARVAATGLAVVALSIIGIFFIPFEGALEIMLPADSDARRTIRFLQEADFADQVAVELQLEAPELTVRDLTTVMDGLAEEFEKSEMVERAVSFPGSRDVMQDMLFFLKHSGELLGGKYLDELKERLTENEIKRRLRSRYIQLMKPEGTFTQEIVRHDPLNIGSVILERIRRMTQSFAYQATVRNGHLIHPEEKHGLLLLQTRVPVTDTVGSGKLVSFIQDVLKKAPETVSGNIISGHQRSVSNENQLKRDIRLTATIAALGFIILFLGVFRDPRAVIIFLIPGAAVLMSLNISGFILGSLSYLVIGFGAVMTGIAVDYGIHVYVSNRHSANPYQAVRRILRPVIIGGLTTLSVFAAFFTSTIPGYRQLAGFSVIAILIAIAAAVLILPALLKTGAAPLSDEQVSIPKPGRIRIFITLLFLGSLAAAVFLARDLKIDTSIARLDGTPDEILAVEENFQKRWSSSGEPQAFAVVKGNSFAEAARENDLFYEQIRLRQEDLQFSSLAGFWPSPATREKNLERWQDFWTEERIRHTRQRIREAGKEYGFSEDAFTPFFESLEQKEISSPPEDNLIFAQFFDRFYQKHNDTHWLISYFPDSPQTNNTVREALTEVPGGFVASQRALEGMLSKSVAEEVFKISSVALVLILGIALVLMRNIRMWLAALLPAACGVAWLFAIMSFAGISLDLANMIAGVVVLGLCIDYGIFMAHGWAGGPKVLKSTRNAVILSAASTLIGAGVLVFAQHPALFSIGLTLVVGVGSGFLAALLAMPGLAIMLGIPGTQTRQEKKIAK